MYTYIMTDLAERSCPFFPHFFLFKNLISLQGIFHVWLGVTVVLGRAFGCLGCFVIRFHNNERTNWKKLILKPVHCWNSATFVWCKSIHPNYAWMVGWFGSFPLSTAFIQSSWKTFKAVQTFHCDSPTALVRSWSLWSAVHCIVRLEQ